ncbi:AglZ/HisF2 family acetamidino modification protein [Flavihumibacter sp.]|uniref:AglZ/HisF2 family acetamidino modification protein n=1 Tax=Flavihumibacter sp. TaxID=1913981 RepID=UPI002FCB7FAE
MRRIRVIPVLLIQDGGLVKSVRFKHYTYVGDPINAVKIFNDKEVDEIVILDIEATKNQSGPDFQRIKEIASEAFVPLAYGGGITKIDEIKQLFYLGVEKVVLNNQAYQNPSLLTEAASLVGSQSVVASVDVKKNWLGQYKVYVKNGGQNTGKSPVEYVQELVNAGAGEIFLNSIDRDGTYNGFDLDLIKQVCSAVNVPVIACGGASIIDDFQSAVAAGASAVAAGSMFVFQRTHRAVLISYPSQKDLEDKLFSRFN